MFINPNPDLEPTRNSFYMLFCLAMFFSLLEFMDNESGKTVAVGLLISSVLFGLVGSVIIHGSKIRDYFFGLTSCPKCNKRVITIKDKLKAKWFGKSYSKCINCSQLLALPWAVFIHFTLLAIIPVITYRFFQNVSYTFLSAVST